MRTALEDICTMSRRRYIIIYMKHIDKCITVLKPSLGCLCLALAHTLDLVVQIGRCFSQRNCLLIVPVGQCQGNDMAQTEIAHGLDCGACAHETVGLVAEEVIQHSRRSGLEHFQTTEKRAGIKIFISHVSESSPVIGAPDF